MSTDHKITVVVVSIIFVILFVGDWLEYYFRWKRSVDLKKDKKP
jgi:hypothetical protein